LWTTYFSSSERVKKIIAVYGDPDIIEIRRKFLDNDWGTRVKKCRSWEDSVIRKMKAVKDPRWLNGNCGGAKFYNAGMMPVKDAIKGGLIGNAPINHPMVLSGDWIHHSTGVTQPVKSCQYCERTYTVSQITDHKEHCDYNPDRKHRLCRYCDKEFTDRRNHVRHQRHCERNPDREPLQEYECQFCKKTYLDAGKRNDHEKYCEHNPNRLEKPVYKCQYCAEKFVNQRMIHSYHEKHCELNPNRIEWPEHKCQFCTKKFNAPGTLKQHERVCQDNSNRTIQQCSFCGRDIGGGSGNLTQHERGCDHKPKNKINTTRGVNHESI